MGTLAAEFGWDEIYILHRLSFVRAEQYYHVALRRAGWKTYLPPEDADSQLREIEEAEQELARRDVRPMEVTPEMEAAFARWK